MPNHDWLNVSFVAFLMRNIASIDHSVVYLVHDNGTEVPAEAIAFGLQAMTIPVTVINVHTHNFETQPVLAKRSLTISFIIETVILQMVFAGNKLYMSSLKHDNKFIIIAPISYAPNVYRTMLRNMLHILFRFDNELDFLVWPPMNEYYATQKYIFNLRPIYVSGEVELVSSFNWLAFCERVDRLPENTQVTVLIENNGPSQMAVVQHKGQLVATGIYIGLAGIVIERIGGEMSFGLTHINQANDVPIIRNVNFVDWRQAVLTSDNRTYDVHLLKAGFVSKGDWSPWWTNRYVVLAPRQLVAPKITWSDVVQRVLLMGMILAVTLGFLMLRLISRRIHSTHQVDSTALLFDTFARTLGLSAGAWLGRSRTERQLLIVVSVFAILMGGVFSGILYERSLRANDVQRFNSIQDLCDNNIPVIMDVTFTLSILAITHTNILKKKHW